jgi:hypothetical protein
MADRRYLRSRLLTAGWWLGLCGTLSCCWANSPQRLVSVRDAIQMTELADPDYLDGASSCGHTASFSPNGKLFVVVVRRGDVARDVNVFSMLLWKVQGDNAVGPRTILRMRSSSIWPGIDPDTIEWSQDSNSLMFLGEHAGDPHELFQLNIVTGVLRALTDHSTSVLSYSRDGDGAVLAYTAIPPFRPLWSRETARRGFPVTTQYLTDVEDLIIGRKGYYGSRGRPAERELFVEDSKGTREIQPLPGSFFGGEVLGRDGRRYVSMSPDGRHILAVESVPYQHDPDHWIRYRDSLVHSTLSFVHGLPPPLRDSASLHFQRYVLVNVQTGRSRIVLDTPVIAPERPVWAPDSRSVILSDVLLPIDKRTSRTLLKRASNRQVVEVNIATGTRMPIGSRCYSAEEWRDNELTCDAQPTYLESEFNQSGGRHLGKRIGDLSMPGSSCLNHKLIQFHRVHGTWQGVGPPRSPTSLDVFLKEDMNTPPKIYLSSTRAGTVQSRAIYDLNPQFRQLRFAKVTTVTWNSSDERQVTAGLYYPVDYRRGQRYPLVIQTHGWDESRFEMDGPFPTAYAAQPLAAHNIFVLQVQDVNIPNIWTKGGQLKEIEGAIQIYRSGVSLLSSQGLVDPDKVGIIGFSRVCLYVKWALAHDPGLFAAASVAEGDDGSYLQYITGQAGYSVYAPSLYGGGPFGQNLESWVSLSPGFNLEHVRTPLWINVLNPLSVLLDWEWFEGLRDLGKPVEMVMLDGRAHEEHQLQTPWDRLVSGEGNVDWFDFWLNGHEDPRSTKAAQYVRWRRLRLLEQRDFRAFDPEKSTGPAMLHTLNSPKYGTPER